MKNTNFELNGGSFFRIAKSQDALPFIDDHPGKYLYSSSELTQIALAFYNIIVRTKIKEEQDEDEVSFQSSFIKLVFLSIRRIEVIAVRGKDCPQFSWIHCCLLKAENAKFRRQNQEPFLAWEEVVIMIDSQVSFGEMEGD